jgi:hypothetical protein
LHFVAVDRSSFFIRKFSSVAGSSSLQLLLGRWNLSGVSSSCHRGSFPAAIVPGFPAVSSGWDTAPAAPSDTITLQIRRVPSSSCAEHLPSVDNCRAPPFLSIGSG